MSHQVIKCPKCNKSDLILTRVSELESSFVYQDGKLTCSGIESIKSVLRHTAACANKDCNHKWVLKRNIEMDDIPLDIATHKLIEYTCITCGLPKKINVGANSTFNPDVDECTECELGITQ